ncbi:RluA family pseudouridine synthase [Trichlorobacter ammonificans]|uniref:Pseudouridine synthase, RluA family n=1 Tax=Trichlorobacter ammonificans TaxID=2916410 RepID=A0ABM9DA13_9BACT|nr:RluA family pseudouridine synthase [Trichlorobacter ammonificans]CAH2032043.1 Pseudouridine synthase, RluA family [Trichlorobacter ammonificans]
MISAVITADDHCRSLESWLQRLLPTATPGYLRKLVKSGACRVNGGDAAPTLLLTVGDRISLKESASVTGYLKGAPAPIDLLWQDDRLLAVNKPAGLAMHPAAEVDENLADLASAWLEKRANCPMRAYPVNRLDRGTSGVVLLATSSGNAGMLGRQVKEEGLEKRYLALAEGAMTGAGEIDLALDGKESVSRYTVLASGGCSLLLVEPVTGRTHQIRRHLSAVGHPVAGDKRYGAAPLENLPGIALHSFRTALYHPGPETLLTICAPLPAPLRELIMATCGLDEPRLLELLMQCAEG